MILHSTDVLRILSERYGTPPRGILVLDAEYRVPTARWLDDTFARAFRKNLFEAGISDYGINRNDCDKFGRHAASQAAMMHARTPGAGETGLAFGWLIYTRDAGGCHELNCCLQAIRGQYVRVVEWEPQTQRRVELSRSELQTVEVVIV